MHTIPPKSYHPLVRILGFGALLAAVLVIILGPKMGSSDQRQIVIGEDDFAHVLASWQKTWQRQPTRQELSKVLQSYVRDEVLYQEALKQGLDQNNAMVKRSLIVQMNMLAESQAEQQPITEADIQAYYAMRQDQFLEEPRLSFAQLYFNADRHPEAENYARKVILDLNRRQAEPAEATDYGDVIMLERTYDRQTGSQINRQFGENFAGQLAELPVGEWSGPVRSSYGWHTIYIFEKEAVKLKPLDAVKVEIIREMEYEEKEAAKEQFYTELMQRYNIVYEGEVKNFMDAQ